MVLMVFFSSRISPLTSTVIFLVRSFQVPATPSTTAWPPSLPSVPTSRATRVTSEAKEPSWSTMVLMVFFSSSISPRTSTVIFLPRSPLATAVVTRATSRTCDVRFDAIEFTFSVRSFHVPETPRTCACPPSRPSVPTSRATRVTSSAKDESWSTMVFTVEVSSRTSPRASTVIFCVRSPVATAVATWAIPRTCEVRFAAMRFTASVRAFQVPATFGTAAWPPSRPSVPTSRATRVTSSANRRSVSVRALIVSASSATSPRALTVILRDRSPWAIAVAADEIERTWSVRLLAMVLTESVRSRHVPETPRTAAWPPSRPSMPTSRPIRIRSRLRRSSTPTRASNSSTTSRPSSRGGRASKRPRRTARSAWASPASTVSSTGSSIGSTTGGSGAGICAPLRVVVMTHSSAPDTTPESQTRPCCGRATGACTRAVTVQTARVPVPEERRIRLAPDARSPGVARRMIVAALNEAGHDAVADTVILLASELCENSVLHAGTEFDVTLRIDAAEVVVTVSDRGAGPLEQHLSQPRRRYGRAAAHGRGLQLLSKLATAWGTRHEQDGTHSTWFSVAIGEPAFAPARPAPAAEPDAVPVLPSERVRRLLHLPPDLAGRLDAGELVAELVRRLWEV